MQQRFDVIDGTAALTVSTLALGKHKLTATYAATADTLSQGGDDLRRSLANAGVTLLSLDIESRGGNGAEAQNQTPASSSAPTTDSDQIDAIADGDAGDQTTSSLPGSALVNVLA